MTWVDMGTYYAVVDIFGNLLFTVTKEVDK